MKAGPDSRAPNRIGFWPLCGGDGRLLRRSASTIDSGKDRLGLAPRIRLVGAHKSASEPISLGALRELEEADGRGLRVAVVDSGISPGHPHVGAVCEGVCFSRGAGGRPAPGTDWRDRIGHGTACAGVIRQILPRAEILAVRVFENRLRTDAALVAAGVRWAVEQGARLVNLSLAALPEGEPALVAACRAAGRAGTVIVAARPPARFGKGKSILIHRPEVIAAGSDPECPPDRFRPDRRRPQGFLASPFARPIAGVPPGVNFNGPSLSAARLTGFAGKVLMRTGPLPAPELRLILARWARALGS